MKLNHEQGRYIILGSVDGILAVLGVVIGISHVVEDPSIIINAAIGGAVALALTNGVGSYLAESAVEYGNLAEIEKPLLRSLESTVLEKETKKRYFLILLLMEVQVLQVHLYLFCHFLSLKPHHLLFQ